MNPKIMGSILKLLKNELKILILPGKQNFLRFDPETYGFKSVKHYDSIRKLIFNWNIGNAYQYKFKIAL